MARRVELYFTSENDAESVRSKLQTQKVNDIFIEEIPNVNENDDGHVLVANDPAYSSGGGASQTLGSGGTQQPIAYTGAIDDVSGKKKQPINQLLTFEVAEEDYPDVLVSLKDLNYLYYDHD